MRQKTGVNRKKDNQRKIAVEDRLASSPKVRKRKGGLSLAALAFCGRIDVPGLQAAGRERDCSCTGLVGTNSFSSFRLYPWTS
jgi:hypothetical protein